MNPKPLTDIPKIIEGVDPFDDQSAALEYIVPEPQETPTKFIEEVRSLLEAKGIPEDEIVYKFGRSLDSLSAMECLEAKDYIGRIQVTRASCKNPGLPPTPTVSKVKREPTQGDRVVTKTGDIYVMTSVFVARGTFFAVQEGTNKRAMLRVNDVEILGEKR